MQETVRNNYKIFDFSFSIMSDSAQTINLFDLVYNNFKQKNGKKSGLNFEIITRDKSGKFPHLKSKEKIYPFHSFSSVESQVFKLLTDELYKRIKSHFLIHGGGISLQNKGVMISGESGTGKTSLIVKLLTKGFQFLSDELIPINKQTGKMEPFPRAIGLRPEARFLLEEGFALFKQKELNKSSGHKYFLNPMLLGPEKAITPVPVEPRFFIYLAKPKSSPPSNFITLTVIREEGEKFLSSIKKVKELNVLECIDKKDDLYIKIEMPRKASVIKEYLKEQKKYNKFILHSERKKDEDVTFDQKPEIVSLPLNDMSLMLLKQLKEEKIESKLRDQKFKSIGSYWLNVVDALNLKNIKGFKIHVGEIEETVQFIQDIVI